MRKDTEDKVYKPDTTEEAKASMKLTKSELNQMKRIAEIKGDATPQQVLRAFLTKALRYDF
ncbi:hypothetical protein N9O58_02995 [Flavobacteriaceae bacterium]|nr:hypothetical protein [Flavobacteriaceae bacterium]